LDSPFTEAVGSAAHRRTANPETNTFCQLLGKKVNETCEATVVPVDHR